jgi:hypothetical protein
VWQGTVWQGKGPYGQTKERLVTMKKSGLFSGGIPTQIGLNKLKKAYGKPECRVYYHEELLNIIGETIKSSHYRTVVYRWKKYLFREYNLVLHGCGEARAVGYMVCTPKEHTEHTRWRARRNAKFAVKIVQFAEAIDTSGFTPQEKDRLAIERRLFMATANAANEAAKTVMLPKPVSNPLLN